MQMKLCESDHRFMSVVWDHEPVSSGELVALCSEKLGWKKSTTYTVLKKLCDKGFVQNEGSRVTSQIPRDEVQVFESGYVIDNSFGGSLPAFVAAFTRGRKISVEEAEEIRRLIDQIEEG